MQPTYRTAEVDDVDPLMDLLRVMHAENGLASLDEDRVRERIAELLEHGQIILAERDTEIIGSIGLIVESWWYSRDLHLAESWIYVHPDHRRSRVIFRLMDAAKETAQNMNLPLVVGLVGTANIERKMKLFARDMEIRGILFVKEG